MSADLFAPQFQDADKAREHLEALRWPNGPGHFVAVILDRRVGWGAC